MHNIEKSVFISYRHAKADFEKAVKLKPDLEIARRNLERVQRRIDEQNH